MGSPSPLDLREKRLEMPRRLKSTKDVKIAEDNIVAVNPPVSIRALRASRDGQVLLIYQWFLRLVRE